MVSEHGVWRNERHGFDTIPLWVRDGSVLVTKPGAETPEYEYGKDALVSVFLNDGDDAKAVVTEMDGSTLCSPPERPMPVWRFPVPMSRVHRSFGIWRSCDRSGRQGAAIAVDSRSFEWG